MNAGSGSVAPASGSDFAALAEALKDRFRQTRPLRAGSFIVTVFGDAIMPRGGSVWLGSLSRVLAPFGISDRLVRTSVFRLVRDGWLEGEQVGRRSYYRLTDDGRRRFARAADHIYSAPSVSMHGDWTLVVLPPADTGLRDRLRKDLAWLGFGRLDAGVLAHPGIDPGTLDDALAEAGATGAAVVMNAATWPDTSGAAVRELAAAAWNLDDLAARYSVFEQRFAPLLDAVDGADPLAPADCLTVRLLMIHEYRRILLRDPRLPREALPENWVGRSASTLCARLYDIVAPGAETCLTESVETVDGPLPPADESLRARFRND